MDSLKNMVVLKNLPSNLIEEAFLILKPNQKIESFEYTPKQVEQGNNSKDYIVKEAEMVISSYLSKNDNSSKIEMENLKKKNKKLKSISIISGVVMLLVTIANILI